MNRKYGFSSWVFSAAMYILALEYAFLGTDYSTLAWEMKVRTLVRVLHTVASASSYNYASSTRWYKWQTVNHWNSNCACMGGSKWRPSSCSTDLNCDGLLILRRRGTYEKRRKKKCLSSGAIITLFTEANPIPVISDTNNFFFPFFYSLLIPVSFRYYSAD